MTFAEMRRNNNGMIIIDGYSKAKTIKGALKDFAREIAKYDKGEADNITNYLDDTIMILNDNYEPTSYSIQCEEVPCATTLNEKTDEMKYAEGNFYLCIRFAE